MAILTMTQYRANEGQEDRHGEMTGAITVNMVLSMMPVGLWCFFVGPWLLSFWPMLIVGLAMAVVLPIACLPLSRKLWARFSDRAERL